MKHEPLLHKDLRLYHGVKRSLDDLSGTVPDYSYLQVPKTKKKVIRRKNNINSNAGFENTGPNIETSREESRRTKSKGSI